MGSRMVQLRCILLSFILLLDELHGFALQISIKQISVSRTRFGNSASIPFSHWTNSFGIPGRSPAFDNRPRKCSNNRSTSRFSATSGDDSIDLTPLAFGTSPEQNDETLKPQPLPIPYLALAGSLTTVVADITMHPMDCIKTLQQSEFGYGLSFLAAARFLFETDGLAGFYHGFLTYAFSDALGGALKFAVWELWKQREPERVTQGNVGTRWGYLALGAAMAFVASSVLIVPGEYIKNQLQMDNYHGLQEAVDAIWSQHGLAGFFVGYDGVLYRDIPYTMLELGLYEIFKSILNSTTSVRERGAWDDIAAAALTGGVTACLTTPMDVIKTKLMVDDAYAGSTFLDCFFATIESHGWTSVFAGVGARIAWILPFTSIYLPTYDFLKHWFWRLYVERLELQNRP